MSFGPLDPGASCPGVLWTLGPNKCHTYEIDMNIYETHVNRSMSYNVCMFVTLLSYLLHIMFTNVSYLCADVLHMVVVVP